MPNLIVKWSKVLRITLVIIAIEYTTECYFLNVFKGFLVPKHACIVQLDVIKYYNKMCVSRKQFVADE